MTMRKIMMMGVAVAGGLLVTAAPALAQGPVTCNGLPATIVGTAGPDSITGTGGDDVVVALGGNDRVFAGPGDDVVCLGEGNDALNGGAGADTLVAEPAVDGTDSFAGGPGVDTARYAGRTGTVAVSLDDVPDDGSGDENDNIHADVENVIGGRAGNTLRGSAAGNVLVGGGVLDVLVGSGGADTLRGGGGNDILVGGPGDDTASGDAGDDRWVADVGPDGADVFTGGSGHDIASYAGRTSPLRFFLDGAANDGTFPFGEGDNVGGPANDVEHVIGGSGDDAFNVRAFFLGATLEGGPGDDGFTTTNGRADRADGGLGTDRCLADVIDRLISCP
jgi:Ca2+-binding RTX toxin-like protein